MSYRFLLEEDGQRQMLTASETETGALDVVINIETPCSRSESGEALPLSEEGDLEVESDPFGEARPAKGYYLESGAECVIAIKIATGDRRYAWLRETEECGPCTLSEEPMERQ